MASVKALISVKQGKVLRILRRFFLKNSLVDLQGRESSSLSDFSHVITSVRKYQLRKEMIYIYIMFVRRDRKGKRKKGGELHFQKKWSELAGLNLKYLKESSLSAVFDKFSSIVQTQIHRYEFSMRRLSESVI
jgi:hypothetical protein